MSQKEIKKEISRVLEILSKELLSDIEHFGMTEDSYKNKEGYRGAKMALISVRDRVNKLRKSINYEVEELEELEDKKLFIRNN